MASRLGFLFSPKGRMGMIVAFASFMIMFVRRDLGRLQRTDQRGMEYFEDSAGGEE
jgi:hypothetical protein